MPVRNMGLKLGKNLEAFKKHGQVEFQALSWKYRFFYQKDKLEKINCCFTNLSILVSCITVAQSGLLLLLEVFNIWAKY